MAYEFKFPDIGEGITNGKVVSWVVKEGDKVKEDQIIAKIETDKALADIPSPKTGTIEKIMVQAGSDVQVGQTLVTIAVEGEEAEPSPTSEPPAGSDTSSIQAAESPLGTKEVEQKTETKPGEKKDSGTGAVGELESAEKPTDLFAPQTKAILPTKTQEPEAKLTPTGKPGLAMPGIRQLAKHHGVDISTIKGTGSQGQVTGADLQGKPSTQQGRILRVRGPSGDVIEITGDVQEISIMQSGKPIETAQSTRACKFCFVKTGFPAKPVDPKEIDRLVDAVSKWKLEYIVVTSVDRDDLPDQGSKHFAECIRRLKETGILVEVLIPDFRGSEECLDRIIAAKPDVIAHNIEVVERLQSDIKNTIRDPRASFRQSLGVLEYIKKKDPKIFTKSSIMVGFGEKNDEVIEAMKELRKIDVNVLMIGQYLRPSEKQAVVKEYVRPEIFKYYKEQAIELGFLYCAAGPFVRTSYRAGELFMRNILQRRNK